MAGTSAPLVVDKRSARPTKVLSNCGTDPSPAGALVGRDLSELDWHPVYRIFKCSTRMDRRAGATISAILFRSLRSNWLAALLLVAVGTITHLPALQGERIWDDQYLSLGNPFI